MVCPYPWFCGVADSEAGRQVSAELKSWATRVVAHPSGRPWLVGSWLPAQLLAVTCGAVRVIVLGTCLISRDEAVAEVERAVSRGTYDRLSWLPGNFHLSVSQLQGVTTYTDLAGLRRLFFTEHRSTVIYASHARVLRALTGAAVDEVWLASRLVCPALAHIRERRAPFLRVRPVPPGHRLTVDNNGTATVARRWHVPTDACPLASSGPRLRAELTSAVHGRVRQVSSVTADLSGGLDSTSLSFLAGQSAAATGASMRTLTLPAASPANDDIVFAQAAVASQPEAEHVFVDLGDYPLPYEDLSEPPPLDEPASFAMSIARVRHVARVLVGLGSQVHLKGDGGDAVLLAPLAYLRRVVRRHPLVAFAHIRMHAALHRRPMTAFLLQLTRPCSYRSWLVATARGVATPVDRPDLGLGWGIKPHAPTWITQDALAAVRDLLTAAAVTLACV